jgi:Tfp pilus assembly protein PilX
MNRLQRGVVLLIALIALVAMSLAGIALMRSVDTGLVIAGNLAFKQASTQIADAGTEQAIGWISANGASLTNDVPAAGYYATWRGGCDLSGGQTTSTDDDVVWDPGSPVNANCGMVAAAVPSSDLLDGYTANFVINRMCNSEGEANDPGVFCSAFIDSAANSSNSTKQGGSYGQTPLSGSNQQYYRITTRVVGPRNTSGIVQTIIAF